MRTEPYPSDLTAAQWDILKPLLPPASSLGRPRKTDLGDILDAILYRNRNGCTWRSSPHDFPRWRTVYKWRWVVERTFAWLGRCRIHSRDYERETGSSEARIRISMIGLMLRRLAGERHKAPCRHPRSQANVVT